MSKRQIQKPYDVLAGEHTQTSSSVNEYSLFCFVSEYEDLGEDCPIYIKLPRNKYVRIGFVTPERAVNNDRCFIVIAR